MTEGLEIIVHSGSLVERQNTVDSKKYYIYLNDKLNNSEELIRIDTVNSTLIEKENTDTKVLIAQLEAQLESVNKKISKDEILFDKPQQCDIAEQGRLKFQITEQKRKLL